MAEFEKWRNPTSPNFVITRKDRPAGSAGGEEEVNSLSLSRSLSIYLYTYLAIYLSQVPLVTDIFINYFFICCNTTSVVLEGHIPIIVTQLTLKSILVVCNRYNYIRNNPPFHA